MKRPPDKKVVLAVTMLLVAAGVAALSRPAHGIDHPAYRIEQPGLAFLKLFGRS